jgi:hypothetical protein
VKHLLARRSLFAAAPLVLAAGVAGCGSTTANQIAVTLANVQAETPIILAALNAYVASLGKTLSAATEATVTKALAAATGAAQQIAALPPSTTASAVVLLFVADVLPIIPLLGLPVATAIAISGGLALLQAFAAGIPSVAKPAAVASYGAEPTTLVGASAPIPIPIPASVASAYYRG